MASALDGQLNAIMDALTAPGAPFETTMIERGGRSLPVFVNAPPSLPALFAKFCADHAEREFLVDGEVRLRFDETHALAVRAARGLIARHGVKPGDRIGIAARNSANWIVAYMGVLIAGGCATLLNGWNSGDELADCIALADCALVLADEPRATRLKGHEIGAPVLVFGHGDPETGLAGIMAGPHDTAALPAIGPDDLATILFTSGSTGTAKGAVSDHRGVVNGLLNYAAQSLMIYSLLERSGNPLAPLQTALVPVPLFHVTAEVPLFLQSFVLGRRLVLMPKWDAREAMRLIEAERITYFVGVPLMSHEIATHPDRETFDLSSCRTYAAGGAPRPADHVTAIVEGLPHGFPILGYGLTETNGVGCGIYAQNHIDKPGSTGPASRPLVELGILGTDGVCLPQGEIGEVAIRSVCNMLEYWRNPEATAAAITPDGWFLTGDLGRLDDDGYLFIVDRKKDIIIRGGENIACLEVEQALYSHPEVAEASVFGLPDARLGEVPVAVWYGPGEAPDEAALREHLAARIAAFKIPVRFWREDQPLPRLGTEKIDKRALKARYAVQWEAVTGGA